MEYNFREIEKKWQQYWVDHHTFKANNHSEKPKYYVLDMFPYPSGAGLHVGHPLGYIASDIYARYKRLKGFNVLHPMGYDSFGLPAEQYAIQTGQHPAVTTQANIKTYRKQLDKMGFSFDWSRELRTSDSKYYRWTQWIFTLWFNAWYNKETDKAEPIEELIYFFEKQGNQKINAACDENTPSFDAKSWRKFSSKEKQKILLRYRLAYLSESEVNWCPALGTVLANDEIINGVSERGGFPVICKKMKQWSIRISAYAERLLNDLQKLDWSNSLKETQRNWIGKSYGAQLEFKIQDSIEVINVFTTRPDTLFGVTFMVLAPEHELLEKITSPACKTSVEHYINDATKRSERERMTDLKSISGVFTGAYAVHPFTEEKIPIWVSDYVLAGYGTGAVMAVPAGDERDYAFAQHFNIPVKNIFENTDISQKAFIEKNTTVKLIHSDFLNGFTSVEAVPTVIKKLEERNIGTGKVNYRLRDAVFSRQRYWGEPFPVYYKDGMPQIMDKKYLPLILPEVEKYLSTEAGEPPLGRAEKWAWDCDKGQVTDKKYIDEINVFPLGLNTMPGWAGSSWYFNRYMDAQNSEDFASRTALDYWQDVDLYVGGAEHATGHLLYSRFCQKFLYDMNLVPVSEFSKKLLNQGMILGNSAFVYRIKNTQQYVSYNLKENYETDSIHINVELIKGNILDIEKCKSWRPYFSDAEFMLEEDGTYRVGFEVEKMSKSKHNVINPDAICEEYGADCLRLYEMFLGPVEQSKPWNTKGLSGVFNFLKKFWKLYHLRGKFSISEEKPSSEEMKILHTAIKKVEEDIENFSFNTSVSTFMITTNALLKLNCNKRIILEPLVILLSSFAPHIAEELWMNLGHSESISNANYPIFEEKWLIENTKEYPVSFNGKMRFKLELSLELSSEEIEKKLLEDKRTRKQLNGNLPKKIIIVRGKIINVVG